MMPELVKKYTSLVLPAHLIPRYYFSRWLTDAILDLEISMIPKLYINYYSGSVMPELLEYDTSFVLLAHLLPAILHFNFFQRWHKQPFRILNN